MAPLSAHSLLSVWAYGRGLHPVDQALALLALLADPGVALEDLAALSLGERDARLVALREETFGPTLTGLAACPQCRERLEFTLSTSDLVVPASAAPPTTAMVIETGGRRLRFRPLNSYDLAAIAGYDAPELARSVLAERCLLDAEPADLSPDVVSDLAA